MQVTIYDNPKKGIKGWTGEAEIKNEPLCILGKPISRHSKLELQLEELLDRHIANITLRCVIEVESGYSYEHRAGMRELLDEILMLVNTPPKQEVDKKGASNADQ